MILPKAMTKRGFTNTTSVIRWLQILYPQKSYMLLIPVFGCSWHSWDGLKDRVLLKMERTGFGPLGMEELSEAWGCRVERSSETH